MYVKKFIFSKFKGLEAYSQQLYYQMISLTGIFWQNFKPPMLPPHIDLSPPLQILKSPPPMPVGDPTPQTTWKINILKKIILTPGYIIILHMCTINDGHIMYDSWDTEGNGHNFLSFWTIVCSFTPNNLKNQNFGKMKKSVDISSFYTSVPKILIICYNVREIWYYMWNMQF